MDIIYIYIYIYNLDILNYIEFTPYLYIYNNISFYIYQFFIFVIIIFSLMLEHISYLYQSCYKYNRSSIILKTC